MKIGRYAVAMAIFSLAISEAGMAKSLHGHHGVAAKAAPSKPARAKEVQSRHGAAAASTEAPVPAASEHPPSGADRSRVAPPKLGETGKGRMRAPIVTVPVVRNAIGIAIAHPEGAIGERGGIGGTPRQAPSAGTASVGPSGGVAVSPIEHPSLQPIATAAAGTASRGKIDGVGMIRPALAPSGLGGPAKVVGSINGTAIRPKH